MAKAHIKTQDGVEMRVEGTPQEIIAIARNLKARETKEVRGKSTVGTKSGKGSLGDLIATLADGSFFKQPKDLASIKAALAEMGHHYPVTTLSPAVLRMVRKRTLRRMKQDKRWVYTRGGNLS